MNPVDFDAWAVEHVARHRFARLPDPLSAGGRSFFGPWLKAFTLMRVDLEIATEASVRLVNNPPAKAADHWLTLKGYCQDLIFARGGNVDASAEDTYETAKAASLACEYCYGAGLAAVWHPAPDAAKKIPVTTAAYCVCRSGRWVRRRHQQTCKDVFARMVDLADVRAGRSVWREDPPDVRAVDPRTPARTQEVGRPPAEVMSDPILTREYVARVNRD